MNGKEPTGGNGNTRAAIAPDGAGLPSAEPAPRELVLVALILATAVIFALANASEALLGADWLRTF